MHVKTGYGNDVRLHRGLTSIIFAKISIPSVRTVFINGKILYGIYHDDTIPIYVSTIRICVLYPTIQNYHLGINDQIVALPFLWHLLTASMALAETPTAGAADDPVDSSCSFTMPYVCSVGIGSHDSVEEHFHARLDILRYLIKFFNEGGRILAVQHGRVCVQASRALQATMKQNGRGQQSQSLQWSLMNP